VNARLKLEQGEQVQTDLARLQTLGGGDHRAQIDTLLRALARAHSAP
jgi:hypothetical protein